MEPNFFAGGVFDRAGLLRKDADWIAAMLRRADARAVPVWRAASLVVRGEAPAAAITPLAPLLESLLEVGAPDILLLGLIGDVPHFAVDLSALDEPLRHPRVGALLAHAGGEFVELRDAAALLPREDAALLAYARALVEWHRRSRHCPSCGAPTEAREGGHVRVCTAPGCGAQHFPRTDPAVIMLVTDGESCLLARRAGNKLPMYSTLAGFVEPGESLEEAVAREVHEEVGIEVGRVDFHSSQPWPFPSQLMIGFYAEAVGGSLKLDPTEIADAKWFERGALKELLARPEPPIMLPRPVSIARRLILGWLNG
ncbi:MAG: NAD(+) diphosphatase [Gemmatimonas sp.]